MAENLGGDKVSQIPQIETLSNNDTAEVINTPTIGGGVVGEEGFP